MQGLQGPIPYLQQGYAALPDLYQSPKWFCYYDYFRGWGLMRVEYVKLNWHTGSKLICVRLYHLASTPSGLLRVESKGSGSEYNGLFTSRWSARATVWASSTSRDDPTSGAPIIRWAIRTRRAGSTSSRTSAC